MKPEISVVMPVFNGAKFLKSSLPPCFQQQELIEIPHEVIVVNDGSNDGTVQILDSWRKTVPENTFRVIEQDNLGVAKAVNKGIEQARGETVVLIDADDILENFALAKLHALFKKGQHALVTGQHSGFDSRTGRRLFTTQKEHFAIRGEAAEAEPLLHAYGLGHPKMIGRATLEKIGGFDPSNEFASDYDAILKVLFPGEMKPWGLVDEVLYYYRVSNNSFSASNRTKQIACAEKSISAALSRLGITGTATYVGRNSTGYLSYGWS